MEDVLSIDRWRAAHKHVLNTFQAIIRNRLRGKDVVVAQRHKRRSTIYNKLRRYPKMQLARMDDVAGCRMIFPSIEKLYEFRNELHSASFNHKLRSQDNRYDYIQNPKNSGYRGVHDVYSYNVRSDHGKDYEGLLVELQYRTRVQHAWATSVEVVGHITSSQPKFGQGDDRYLEIFRFASEILARAFEDRTSCLSHLKDEDIVREFLALDQEIGLIRMLRGLNEADNEIGQKQNVILIFSGNEKVEVRSFRRETEALRELFRLEEEMPDRDIVLVKADSEASVKEAFKNYFSDSRDFIKMIEIGCRNLMGGRAVYIPPGVLGEQHPSPKK